MQVGIESPAARAFLRPLIAVLSILVVTGAPAQPSFVLTPADRMTTTPAPAGAERGAALAANGDDLFVGAPGQAPWGAVYWYRYDGSAWELMQPITVGDIGAFVAQLTAR